MEGITLVGTEVDGVVESPVRRPNYPLNKDLTALVLSFLEVEEQRNFSQISIDFYRAAEEAVLGDLRELYKGVREFVHREEGGLISEEVGEQIQRGLDRIAHELHQEELGCEEREALVYRELITLEQGAYDSIKNELSKWPKVRRAIRICRQSIISIANREKMLKSLVRHKKFHIAKMVFDIIQGDEFLSGFAESLYSQDKLDGAYKVAILIKGDKRKEILTKVYNRYVKARKLEVAFSIAKEHMQDAPVSYRVRPFQPWNKIHQFTDIPTIFADQDKWSQALESIPYVMQFSSEGEDQWKSLISLATEKGKLQKEMVEAAYDWLKRRCGDKAYADALLSRILKVLVVYHDDYKRAEEILLAEAPWSREIEKTRQEICAFRLVGEEKFEAALERIKQIDLPDLRKNSYFYDLAILAARKGDKENLKRSLSNIRCEEAHLNCLAEAAYYLKSSLSELHVEFYCNDFLM